MKWLNILTLIAILSGCETPNEPEKPAPKTASRIEMLQPLPTEAEVGAVLSLQARVSTSTGDPVANSQVQWSVTDSLSGSVAVSASLTNTEGVATTTWTLGTKAGSQSVEVSVNPTVKLAHTIRSHAGAAAQVLIIAHDTLFYGETSQATIEVKDRHGNPLTPTNVAWSGSGNAVSVEQSGALRAGSVGGTTTLIAEANGLSASKSLVVDRVRYREISAGKFHACAIAQRGALFCWGSNRYGQIGDKKVTDRVFQPLLINANMRFEQLGSGSYHSCALTKEGKAYCWGAYANGRIGVGTYTSNGEGTAHTDSLMAVAGGHTFRSLHVGTEAACATSVEKHIYCWGSWISWKKGNSHELSEKPVRILALEAKGVVEAYPGWISLCGLTATGEALCYGSNNLGETGTGSLAEELREPTPVAGGHRFRSLSLGLAHGCGVTTTDEAYCWGYNAFYQGGHESTERCQDGGLSLPCSRSPQKVLRLTSVKTMDAISDQGQCAVQTDGRALCWGHNLYGQLGNGMRQMSTDVRAEPYEVVGGLQFVRVGMGEWHGCGLTAEGDAYCWGWNEFGALGSQGGTEVSGCTYEQRQSKCALSPVKVDEARMN